MKTQCMVCEKHKNFESFTGIPIAETTDWFVSHFPIIGNDRANKGHLLIESKRHITDAAELTDSEASSLGLLARDAIRLLTKTLDAEHAYIFRINDKVAHFHVHIVPRFPGTPLEFWGHRITEWPDFPKLDLVQVKEISKFLATNW